MKAVVFRMEPLLTNTRLAAVGLAAVNATGRAATGAREAMVEAIVAKGCGCDERKTKME